MLFFEDFWLYKSTYIILQNNFISSNWDEKIPIGYISSFWIFFSHLTSKVIQCVEIIIF
jgi:hypothetical protein